MAACRLPSCNRPAYIAPNGKAGLFCSKAHSDEYSSMPPPTRGGGGGGGYGGGPPGICAIQGCNRPCFVGKSGNPSPCCGRTHMQQFAQIHQQQQLARRPARPVIESKHDPGLIWMTQSDPKWKSVIDQFHKTWVKTPKPKQILGMHRIYNSKLFKAQKAYEQKVAKEIGGRANVRRRFHGTKIVCSMEPKDGTQLCDFKKTGCALCSIIANGFLMTFASRGRMGKGLYFAPDPSKSWPYMHLRCPGRKTWTMIVCTVVCGKAAKYTQDTPSLTGPPAGHHCVVADTGGSFDQSELIVFEEAACLPAYLIHFTV